MSTITLRQKQIIDAFYATNHPVLAALKLGISRARVYHVLLKHGIKYSVNELGTRKTKLDRSEIIRLSLEGYNTSEISIKTGYSNSSIRVILSKASVKTHYDSRVKYTREVISDAYLKCGGNYTAMAKMLNTYPSSISRSIKYLGMEQDYPPTQGNRSRIKRLQMVTQGDT
jgi:hypothetical protein